MRLALIVFAFVIALSADAREEVLRWTHPGGEPAPVRFEASVNDGARINLGFPAPNAEGIYSSTLETNADPARIRAYAVAADGTSSFPSNEIIRTASGAPPDPDAPPVYELVVGQSCTDAVPLDGHEAGSWPVIVCPPPAEATFDNGRRETSAPIARCGDTGPGKVNPCELEAGQVVTATADGVEITATVGGGPAPEPEPDEPLFCRGDYNGDGAISGADVVEFAKQFAQGCPQP